MAKAVSKNPPKKSVAKKVVKKITKKAAAPKKASKNNTAKKVPGLKMYNGKKLPMIGLGTFGSDHMSNDNI